MQSVGRGTQSWIAKSLRKAEGEQVGFDAVLVRFRRWTKNEHVELIDFRKRMFKVGSNCRHCAHCAAVVHLLSNGVCTGKRFQTECKCKFGCQEVDDLLHFWKCPALFNAVEAVTKRLNWNTYLFLCHMGKEIRLVNLVFASPTISLYDYVRNCLMIDAIIHAHNQARSKNIILSQTSLQNHLHERIISKCGYSSFLEKCINRRLL